MHHTDIDIDSDAEVANELYEEIRQISRQYCEEVPSKRRTWPESIKSRVYQLWQLGMASNQIAIQTGISAKTLCSWKKKPKSSRFVPITLSDASGSDSIALPSVSRSQNSHELDGGKNLDDDPDQHQSKIPSLAIVLKDNVRIEGLNFKSMLLLLDRLGALQS